MNSYKCSCRFLLPKTVPLEAPCRRFLGFLRFVCCFDPLESHTIVALCCQKNEHTQVLLKFKKLYKMFHKIHYGMKSFKFQFMYGRRKITTGSDRLNRGGGERVILENIFPPG